MITNYTAIYTALMSWVSASLALAGVTESTAIIANPVAAPGEPAPERPAGDHITLRVISWDEPRDGTADVFDGVAGRVLTVERQGSIDVQGYGTATRGWLEAMGVMLQDEDVWRALHEAGLALVAAGGIADLTAVLDTGHEPRFTRSFDVDYRLTTDSKATQAVTSVVLESVRLERVPEAIDALTYTLTITV